MAVIETTKRDELLFDKFYHCGKTQTCPSADVSGVVHSGHHSFRTWGKKVKSLCRLEEKAIPCIIEKARPGAGRHLNTNLTGKENWGQNACFASERARSGF